MKLTLREINKPTYNFRLREIKPEPVETPAPRMALDGVGEAVKSAAATVPYLGISALKGVMSPVLPLLKSMGMDTGKTLDTAIEFYGKHVPKGPSIPDVGVWFDENGDVKFVNQTDLKTIAGQTAEATGFMAPLSATMKAGGLVASKIPNARPFFKSIVKGMVGGALLGEGDKDKTLENAALFGVFEPLASAIGKAPEVPRLIKNSTPWRQMTIKERGLVLQSLDETIAKNPGISEGEILRRWNNPEWRSQATARRAKGEVAESVIAPEAKPAPEGAGSAAPVKLKLREVVPDATAEGTPALPPGAEAEPAPTAPPLRAETTPRSSGAGEATPKFDIIDEFRNFVEGHESHMFDIRKDGKLIGGGTYSLSPDGTAKIGKISAFDGKNQIGVKGLLGLKRQIQKQNPKIKRFVGDRVGKHLPPVDEPRFTPEELAAIEKFQNTGTADIAKAESIAEQYGLKYDGQADGNLYQFTDPISRGTLSVKAPEEAPAAFNKLRADRGLELLDEGTLSDVASKAPTKTVEALDDATTADIARTERAIAETQRGPANPTAGTPEAEVAPGIKLRLREVTTEAPVAQVDNSEQQKQPWEMTREEYLADEERIFDGRAVTPRTVRQDFPVKFHTRRHRDFIEQAISEGKPVPESVLKDYPDLQPSPTKPEAMATPAGESVEPVQTKREKAPLRLWHGSPSGEIFGGKFSAGKKTTHGAGGYAVFATPDKDFAEQFSGQADAIIAARSFVEAMTPAEREALSLPKNDYDAIRLLSEEANFNEGVSSEVVPHRINDELFNFYMERDGSAKSAQKAIDDYWSRVSEKTKTIPRPAINEEGRVPAIEVSANLDNMLVVDAKEIPRDAFSGGFSENDAETWAIKQAREKGYDSLLIKNVWGEGSEVYVALKDGVFVPVKLESASKQEEVDIDDRPIKTVAEMNAMLSEFFKDDARQLANRRKKQKSTDPMQADPGKTLSELSRDEFANQSKRVKIVKKYSVGQKGRRLAAVEVDGQRVDVVIREGYKDSEEYRVKEIRKLAYDQLYGRKTPAGESVEERDAAYPTTPKAAKIKAGVERMRQQEAKLAEEVKTSQTEKTQRGAVGINLNAKGQPKPFQFSDPQAEADYRRMKKGVTREPMLRRVAETMRSIGHKLSREFEHLPKTKANAEVSFALRRLSKQKGVAKHRTLEALRGVTLDLNPQEYDLFSRKVIMDDLLETAKQGKDVPIYGNDVAAIEAELDRLDAYVNANPDVQKSLSKRQEFWEALKQDYISAMSEVGFNVEKRLQRESYFRHQVMDYVKANGIFGTGKRLHSPSNRSHTKMRTGSTQDINMDYLQAESEVIAQMIYDIEVAKTISLIDRNYNISRKVRAEAKKNGIENWREALPEGYTIWQPAKGNVFYMADSIPAKVAEELMSGIVEELGVKKEDLRKVMAVGGKRKEFVIPEEIALTLDNLVRVKSQNPIVQWQANLINAWKQWQLLSPRRYFKYNIRNMTGDSDAVFTGNPKAFAKIPKAVHDLYEYYVNDKPMSPEMRDWFERGGMETTLQQQEMGELDDLKIFAQLYQKKGKLSKLPQTAWKSYWKAARVSTDFREAILRYANYLSFLNEMQAMGGLPKYYAASIPEEVQGLSDIKDRAFMMSNDLLGAYDRVSVAGQAIRDHIFPFWSFPEVNMKRYHRMLRNAMYSGNIAEKVGRKVLGSLARTPFMAIRVGRFLIAASALWTLTQLWNNWKFPEAEKALPIDVKRRPHVILGTGKNGEVYYFNRIGAVGDLLEWFGLDVAPNNITDWMHGRKTLKEIAIEMAKAPVNKVVQGSVPFIKLAGELIARQSTFPDAFEPRTIRDRAEHLARSFGLGEEYKAIAGKPSRSYTESLYGLAVYKIDPLESAYNNIFNRKQRFLKTIGRTSDGFFITPAGNALYNFRLAWRYGDKEASQKYLAKYIEEYVKQYGGDPKDLGGNIRRNIKGSFQRMNPLHDLSQSDQAKFFEFLDAEGKEELVKAMEFYYRLAAGEQFKK